MSRTVVPPQHNIVVEVHSIRLGEASACAQQRHYLHGMRVLHLALASHGDAAPGEQRAGRNQRGNNVLVVALRSAFVVIGHAAQAVQFCHTVQSHGSGGSMPQLVLRAERVDGECLPELSELLFHVPGCHLVSQDLQLTHLHYFEVGAKDGRQTGKVGIDIEHAAIVMPKQTHTVLPQAVHHRSRTDPILQFPPHLLIVQMARQDIVLYASPCQDGSQLRDGTSLAVSQPLGCHLRSVAHRIEASVVDGRGGLHSQQQHRAMCFPCHRQHRGGKGVGGDIHTEQSYPFVIKLFDCLHRPFRTIHETDVNHVSTHLSHPAMYLVGVGTESGEQALVLCPIRFQAYSHQSYFHTSDSFV